MCVPYHTHAEIMVVYFLTRVSPDLLTANKSGVQECAQAKHTYIFSSTVHIKLHACTHTDRQTRIHMKTLSLTHSISPDVQ